MISFTVILALSAILNNSGHFEEGDWVTYTNFRYVTAVAMDQTIVYFGTTGGIIRYDRFAKKWLDPLTVTDGIPNGWIDNIAYDPDWDRIWVATPDGNAYYQPIFKTWYRGGDFPVELAHNDFDAEAFPLLHTEFGYSYQDGRLMDFNMQEFPLTRGAEDDYDNLFVGTWGMGPAIINTRYRDLNIMPYGPYSANISTVVKIGDDFWMGDGLGDLTAGAISKFDRLTGKWQWFQPRYVNGLASSRLTSAAGQNSIVWLGTEYGVVRYDDKNDSFTAYADFSRLPSVIISSVAEDSLWVFAGTDNGLGYIGRKDSGRTSKGKEPANSTSKGDTGQNSVTTIELQQQRLIGWRINNAKIIGQYLYLSTDRGALRRPLNEDAEFEFVNTPSRMLSTEILDTASAGDSLYFLTRNDVLIVDLNTEESFTVTDHKYFGQWRLRRIQVDGKNIWAATDIGLWKYSLEDGYSRLFTVGDGMISDDVRNISLDGNYIWVATPGGLIRFFWNDPGRID